MKPFYARAALLGGTIAAVSIFLASATPAQNGYAVGENTPPNAVGSQQGAKNPGPVRMARISYMTGSVSWRPSETVDWSAGSMNLPLRQGAAIWAKGSSRTEVQFDDGSIMRLGGDAIAILQTMYADGNGEFTEIKQTQGLATYHLRSNASEFQIDTPCASVKAYGPTDMRIGVAGVVEVVVRTGQATVDTSKGETVLKAGQRMVVRCTQTVASLGGSSSTKHTYAMHREPRVAGAYAAAPAPNENYYPETEMSDVNYYPEATIDVTTAPAYDNWDTFCSERDDWDFHENSYLPADINICAGNLDAYGSWYDDPQYGNVWCPSESADWRPYQDGQWAWVSPVGWTWVGNEPWGWAPYHYGTWFHSRHGWAWDPGPAYQYWSPAVVDFSSYDRNVAWAPLAPWEVRYPSSGFSIGFSSGDWTLSFSIGQTGCYYPVTDSYCEARPWANVFVNQYTTAYDPVIVNTYYNEASYNSDQFWGQNRFMPYNAYRYNGAVYAPQTAFFGGGHFTPLATNDPTIFRRGRSYFGDPRSSQVSGPLLLEPTQMAAFTPRHQTYGRAPRPQTALLQRPVFRSNLPQPIAMRSAPMRGRVFTPAVNRGGMFAANQTNRGGFGAQNQAGFGAQNGTNRTAMNNNRAGSFGPGAAANRTNNGAFAANNQNGRFTPNGNAFGRNRNLATRNPQNAGRGIGFGNGRSATAARTPNRGGFGQNQVAANNAHRGLSRPINVPGRGPLFGGNRVATNAHRNAFGGNRVAANAHGNGFGANRVARTVHRNAFGGNQVASNARRNAFGRNRNVATRTPANAGRGIGYGFGRVAQNTRRSSASAFGQAHRRSTFGMSRAPVHTNNGGFGNFGRQHAAPQRSGGFGGFGGHTAPQHFGGFGGGHATPPRRSGGFGGGHSAPQHFGGFGGGHAAPPRHSGGFGGFGGGHSAPQRSGGFGGGHSAPQHSGGFGGGGGHHSAPPQHGGGFGNGNHHKH